jgi:hypothetical protein
MDYLYMICPLMSVCLLFREFEFKMLKAQKTKEEIEAFHKARDAWKQKEREEIEDENRSLYYLYLCKFWFVVCFSVLMSVF